MLDFMGRELIVPKGLPTSRTDNPFWDIVRTIPGNSITWKYEHKWEPDGNSIFADGKLLFDRHILCGEYAWAIPDPDSLDFVAQHLQARAVEIGAGTGYFAWQLSQLGVDILAYDLFPPQHTGENHYHSPRTSDERTLIGETRHVFYDVRSGNHLIATKHPERTLFLCWPPYNDDMAFLTLQAYTGKRVVYIGEGDGGCTGDDDFHALLAHEWEEIADHKPVQWWGIHDYITVYERQEVEEKSI